MKNLDTRKEYDRLYKKVKNKTITTKELERLNVLAFGTEFMQSNSKGRLQEIEITTPSGAYADTLTANRLDQMQDALVEINEILDAEYKDSELQVELGNVMHLVAIIKQLKL